MFVDTSLAVDSTAYANPRSEFERLNLQDVEWNRADAREMTLLQVERSYCANAIEFQLLEMARKLDMPDTAKVKKVPSIGSNCYRYTLHYGDDTIDVMHGRMFVNGKQVRNVFSKIKRLPVDQQ